MLGESIADELPMPIGHRCRIEFDIDSNVAASNGNVYTVISSS